MPFPKRFFDFDIKRNTKVGGEFINVQINAHHLSQYMTKVQQAALSATQKFEVSKKLADQLLEFVDIEELVPYRDEYPLAKTKKEVYKKGRKTKTRIIRDYYKKHKYNSYEDVGSIGEWVTKDGETKFVLKKKKKRTTHLISETSSKKLDYHRISAKDPLKSYMMQDKKTEKRVTHTPVADRPPHLKDSAKVIKGAGGLAAITYSVHKQADERFKQNSKEFLQDYAAKQYYANDATWKRFRGTATSRWLEVAVGAPIRQQVKIPESEYAKDNREALANIVKDYILKNIRGGK